MIAKFKEKNENWANIRCVTTDKDMTERSVLKAEMTQVEIANMSLSYIKNIWPRSDY